VPPLVAILLQPHSALFVFVFHSRLPHLPLLLVPCTSSTGWMRLAGGWV